MPERAEVCVDTDYVLAGVGLLADEDPKAAEGLAAHIHGTDRGRALVSARRRAAEV